MAEWYVKDLSKLTQVSVQTLHHYDRIGLLTPSVRLPNGYRLYSEKDLLTLQQIIALKFFGFSLAQIKMLLATNANINEQLRNQAYYLEEKAKSLIDASHTLKKIIATSNDNKSDPWQVIIKSIEVYRMAQELEKTWAGKVFNSDELKEYINFGEDVKNRMSEKEHQQAKVEWQKLVSDVEANLTKAPDNEFGMALGKRCMDWVNKLYGKEYVTVRNALWEKGFKQGQLDEAEHGLSSAGVSWLDKAIDAYYRHRIYGVLNDVGKQPEEEVSSAWLILLTDMYGDDESSKVELYHAALADNKISDKAKAWLKKMMSNK